MDSVNVLALVGSLRRGSYNRMLLEAAAELGPQGMRVHLHEGLGRLPFFDEDVERETGGGAEVRRLREAIAGADALLIATPEYNHSVPAVLKNAIDWMSRPGPARVLEGKPVAIIGVTPGRWGTRLAQGHLRQVLGAADALVSPQSLYVAGAALNDEETLSGLRSVLAALARWIERVSPASAR